MSAGTLLLCASVALLLGFRSGRARRVAVLLAVVGMLLSAARGCGSGCARPGKIATRGRMTT